MAPIITDYLSKEAATYFDNLCSLLEKAGINYEINNFLVRGLDYYAHTTFEFKATQGDYKDALGGGGRYDRLLSLFDGPDVSGIGFAFGIERLMLLLGDTDFENNLRKVAVVPVTDEENETTFELYKLLLNCDIPSEFFHIGNISKKMKVANRRDCEIAIIVGETELKNNTLTVKFMKKDKDETKIINRNDIINFLKYNL